MKARGSKTKKSNTDTSPNLANVNSQKSNKSKTTNQRTFQRGNVQSGTQTRSAQVNESGKGAKQCESSASPGKARMYSQSSKSNASQSRSRERKPLAERRVSPSKEQIAQVAVRKESQIDTVVNEQVAAQKFSTVQRSPISENKINASNKISPEKSQTNSPAKKENEHEVKFADLDEATRNQYRGAWSDSEDEGYMNDLSSKAPQIAATEEFPIQTTKLSVIEEREGAEYTSKASSWAAERNAFLSNKRLYEPYKHQTHKKCQDTDPDKDQTVADNQPEISEVNPVLVKGPSGLYSKDLTDEGCDDWATVEGTHKKTFSTNRGMQQSINEQATQNRYNSKNDSASKNKEEHNVLQKRDNLNTIAYKMELSKKYAAHSQYFRVYQTKLTSDFRPYEQSEVDLLTPEAQKRYETFIHGSYKGENELGVPHGSGKLKFDIPYMWSSNQTLANEICSLFRGQFQKGRLVHGLLQFMDNSYYVGDFSISNNKYHGIGRLTYINSVYYQGDWVNGERHGQGEELLVNGDRYIGSFFEGQRHGQGQIIYKRPLSSFGKISYQGEWTQNRIHGRGREYFRTKGSDPDNSVVIRIYDGQFENGWRNGFGILTDNFEDIQIDAKERMKLVDPAFNWDAESEEQAPPSLGGFQNHYSYKGQWRDGVREGFGVECISIDTLQRNRAKREQSSESKRKYGSEFTQSIDCHQESLNAGSFQNYEPFSQTEYYETKYSGFFVNNKRSGEGCVELRDESLGLVGWYLGRYENGVRHGFGQDIFIQCDENTNEDKYQIVERAYNKGVPVPKSGRAKGKIVDDILSNIQFFGFMGLVEKQQLDAPAVQSDLNLNLELDIQDREFPEVKDLSIYSPQEEVPAYLKEQYDSLEWVPIRSHLFTEDFESILTFDFSKNVLDFNKALSSLLAVIASSPTLLKSYFPQTQMYYSKEDEQIASELMDHTGFGKIDIDSKPCTQKYYYEGFVKLFDGGHTRSVYINAFIPQNPDSKRFFYINTKQQESWVLLLVKALAKYTGSYDNLSKASLSTLSSLLFGSVPFEMSDKALGDVYNAKYPLKLVTEQRELRNQQESTEQLKSGNDGQNSAQQMQFDTYRNLYQALKSKKFIIIARKREHQRKKDQPKYLTKKMLDQMERGFKEGFHYRVAGIPNDAGSSSNIELVSKFKMISPDEAAKLPPTFDPTARIVPTVEQFRHLFDEPQLIQNPLETHSTLYEAVFIPSYHQKFHIFVLEFQVGFSDTLVQLNLSVEGNEASTKIRSMPVQYFIGKQYKHQYMYVAGRGQQNIQSLTNTHCLGVGNYVMLLELEVPNDELNGREITVKVAMQSSETFFMLANKYSGDLHIYDERVQQLYNQMYSSLAIQNEQRQYFDLSGQIFGYKEQIAEGGGTQKKGQKAREEDKIRSKKDQETSKSGVSGSGSLAPSPISMIQHYNEEHKAYIQYIQNDSATLQCVARTTVQYQNMLQMGDAPYVPGSAVAHKKEDGKPNLDSVLRKEGDLRKQRLIETDEDARQNSSRLKDNTQDSGLKHSMLGVQKAIKDIHEFSREVYDQVTTSLQSYSLDQRADSGGDKCLLVVRQVRGGKLFNGGQFTEKECQFALEIDRTNIRLVQQLEIHKKERKEMVQSK